MSEKIDLSNISDTEAGNLVISLLKNRPVIIGIIKKLIDDSKSSTTEKVALILEKTANGTITLAEIENFTKEMSQRYSSALAEVSLIEKQLNKAEATKNSILEKKGRIKIATLPLALIIDFIKELQATPWAKVVWEEEAGTKCPNISEYARLVDIYVSPNNGFWRNKIFFTAVQNGYISQEDYLGLEKISRYVGCPYFT